MCSQSLKSVHFQEYILHSQTLYVSNSPSVYNLIGKNIFLLTFTSKSKTLLREKFPLLLAKEVFPLKGILNL